jgi:outer membrane protein assembly factor BamE (lipoprotein component of BamABCDE complex)
MKKIISVISAGIIVPCLLLILAGCVSQTSETGTKLDATKVAQIKKGITTRAEVEALLGPPTNVDMMAEGKRVLSYNYTQNQVNAHPTATAFIPGASLFTSTAQADAKMQMQTLQVMVNAAGIVDDYEFSDNTTNTTANVGGGLLNGNQSTTSNSAPTQSQ